MGDPGPASPGPVPGHRPSPAKDPSAFRGGPTAQFPPLQPTGPDGPATGGFGRYGPGARHRPLAWRGGGCFDSGSAHDVWSHWRGDCRCHHTLHRAGLWRQPGGISRYAKWSRLRGASDVASGWPDRHGHRQNALQKVPCTLQRWKNKPEGQGAGQRIRILRFPPGIQSGTVRRRSAFATTETEDRLMARAAIMGDSTRPTTG